MLNKTRPVSAVGSSSRWYRDEHENLCEIDAARVISL